MSLELYFVPILAKALARPDVKKSLEEAFAAIKRLGHQKDYTEGFRNFCRFMSESDSRRQLLNEQAIRTAILRYAESTCPEAEVWEELCPIEKDQNPQFRNEYAALRQEFSLSARGIPVPIIQVLCDGKALAQVRFPTRPARRIIDSVKPGLYTLKLNCGLVIWEGQLCTRDLIWTQAYRGKNLKLAAETSDIRRRPVREIQVPEAAIIMRTFACLETGSLEIELTG
ncbi:MAG: hypothetical protein ACYSWO_03635 [Planctomycetota bacterium]|jgi:hypothetical protein